MQGNLLFRPQPRKNDKYSCVYVRNIDWVSFTATPFAQVKFAVQEIAFIPPPSLFTSFLGAIFF